jgi:hypothetical protein
MKRRRLPITKSSKVRRQRDPIPWKYCVLTAVCGLILAGGFFVAAKQHFSSIEYAMKNAELRQKITILNNAERKLIVERERASSPRQVTKLARHIGFMPQPGRVVSAPVYQQDSADDNSPVYSYIGEDTGRKVPVKKAVVKTVSAKPVRTKAVKSDISDASKISVDQIAALEEWDQLSRKD